MKKHLLMLLGALIALNAYAYDFEVNGIYYNYDEDSATNSVSVTSADNTYSYSGDIVIPESVTYDGKTYSVTSIGGYAFHSCKGLTSVTIPNSVAEIGESAFSRCSALTSVTIPNSVTEIGNSAFFLCSGMTSVTIPNSVTKIGDSAFSGCSGLTSVTIPNSVTKIGYYAFSSCSGLTSVTIPNSVTEIGYYAFSGCSGLTEITVAEGNENYSSENGVLFNKNKSLLITYPASKTGAYAIPNSVTTIGGSAFSGCSGVTSVTIPNSVTEIGNGAFSCCSGLTKVTIGNSVTYIGSSAFYDCSGLTSVTIPNSVTIIDREAFSRCSGLTSVTYLAEEPVECEPGFDTEVYEKATLNYLKSAEEKIAATEPWSKFKNRIGRDADFKDDSSITEVRNAEAGTTAVYDMRGVKVGDSTEGLPKGVYIVRKGSQTKKVAI